MGPVWTDALVNRFYVSETHSLLMNIINKKLVNIPIAKPVSDCVSWVPASTIRSVDVYD